MNWFIKHTRSKYGSGPSPLKFTETTDNPTGDPDKTQWGEEQQTNQTVDQSDWRETDGRLVRDTTTTTDFTQSGTSAGQSYKEAGVNPDEAKAYWAANPEKYEEYKKSQNVSRQRQDVQTSQEFKDLPEDTSVPAPEKKPEFKPYNIRMTRGTLKSFDSGEGGKRKGIGNPQFTDFKIDTPEKEADYKSRLANYSQEADKKYAPLSETHFGTSEKARARAREKNKTRAEQREAVRSRVINTDSGQQYNVADNKFYDIDTDNSPTTFSLNPSNPVKGLNTEGTFSYKQNKTHKKLKT
jgi:hypothetical protein